MLGAQACEEVECQSPVAVHRPRDELQLARAHAALAREARWEEAAPRRSALPLAMPAPPARPAMAAAAAQLQAHGSPFFSALSAPSPPPPQAQQPQQLQPSADAAPLFDDLRCDAPVRTHCPKCGAAFRAFALNLDDQIRLCPTPECLGVLASESIDRYLSAQRDLVDLLARSDADGAAAHSLDASEPWR
jgi:hypothetical protein